jgi:regulatory protein YycI of two-component signal transduction system YycFG
MEQLFKFVRKYGYQQYALGGSRMNFKKIELIFFIAFIVLDVFLFTSYMQKDDLVESTVNTFSNNTTDSIMKSIKNDQISYSDLSTKRSSGYYLASPVKNTLRNEAARLHDVLWSYNDQKLTVSFDNSVKLKNVKNPQTTLNILIKDKTRVLYGEDYVYSKSLSTKNVVVYTQKIRKLPVYATNGQIRFNIKNGYVLNYSQSYLSNVQVLKEQKPIISQKRALIWLYQYNKLVNNSTVKWVHLAYTRLLTVNGSVIYIPTWVLAVESNSSGSIQYRRINAFTGAFMEQN